MIKSAAAIEIVSAMLQLPDEERAAFLHDVLSCAAGALVAIEGHERATEHVFRIADATLGRSV